MAEVCCRTRIMIVPLILLVAVSGVLAEEQPVLQLGALVGVTFMEPEVGNQHEPKRITGKLIGLTKAKLALEISVDEPPTVILRRNVEGLELNLQRGRRKKGALTGLAVGAGAGFLYGALVAGNSGANQDERHYGAAWVSAVDHAILLAPIGALIGLLVSPGEKWQEVLSDKMQLGYDDCRRVQSGLLVAIRF